jgi:hypothetical protein
MMLLNVLCKRQNGLDDEPNQEKVNVPPSSKSQEPTTKQQKKSNFIITRGEWSTHAMAEAKDAVEKRDNFTEEGK